MWKFWQYHTPVWSPADEGAGGSGEGNGDGGSGGEGEGAGGEGGAGEGSGGDAAKPSSILDFADKSEPKADGDPGDAWKMPEGMELPDHLVGTTADETLAKLSKAYQGARRELSTRKKGEGSLEGAVPESPDGYKIEAEGDDDKIAAELNSEDSKPIVDAFRKAAMEVGIPDQAFAKFMRQGLANAGEAGFPFGLSNDEAAQLSGEQEMATLTEQVGKSAAQTIVNTTSKYAEKLAQRGVLKDDADIAEFAQMVGTARASQIFHRILTGEWGEKPIPAGEGMDGSVDPMQAQAEYAKAAKMPQGAERTQAMAKAHQMMEKAFGNQPAATGSVRSNVL